MQRCVVIGTAEEQDENKNTKMDSSPRSVCDSTNAHASTVTNINSFIASLQEERVKTYRNCSTIDHNKTAIHLVDQLTKMDIFDEVGGVSL